MDADPDKNLAIPRPSTTVGTADDSRAVDAKKRRQILTAKLRERMNGLSTKLLTLTIVFVMVSEIFVFVPSIAKFRNDWLTDRLNRAETAVIILQEPEAQFLPPDKLTDILRSIDALALAHRVEGRRIPLGMLEMPPPVHSTFNAGEWSVVTSIMQAFNTLTTREQRSIRVIGTPEGSDDLVEIVVDEVPLQADMWDYALNVLTLSLIISVLTATMIYFALNGLFVRPVRRMADNMIAFMNKPNSPASVIDPSGRQDEIGIAEDRLAAMQKDLQSTLHQQKRLADLGLAVSKINHDLRNILSSVQLFTDRISMLPDPTVQRIAPKMLNALDRAIDYCQSSLAYGSAEERAPEMRVFQLRTVADEIGSLLNLSDTSPVQWANAVADNVEVKGDPEQIFRVLMNLSRNAIKAMESMDGDGLVRRLTIAAEKQGNALTILVEDTGPGVPQKAKESLFQAFKGSVGKGGTGLGLAIAHELVIAHKGSIELVEHEGAGACFKITLPQ